ncbi:ROK family protein [Sphaerisporangium sp. TRM90804]|uniref:ROK family protein n=1 Tax=Sphaerisporangium sp. TRM90804 TaxID=3031113 RepID=UPI00244BE5D2|nr:ROK family protein [Sphaerisporangium sp. TRM90804]MDH2427317.1 ROK family protein [Sphaerisporangium sp. TRM90804]
MSRPISVLDVGGTHLRWATWSRGDGLGPVGRAPTPSLANGLLSPVDELRARLVAMMARAVPEGGVAGVSFGAALDHRSGTVYASAPLWGSCTRPFDLLGALSAARPDVRWHVVNDVTAALLHLAAGLAGERCRKVLLVTVSTGIACRVLDRRSGEIPVDGCGLQGEIGHLPGGVSMAGRPVDLRCECGEMNHVSSFSSGPGIRRLARVRRERDPDGWRGCGLDVQGPFEESLASALDAGDPVAEDVLRMGTRPVADVVRTAMCLDPELDLVAFTGGVVHALGAHYRRELLRHLSARGLYLTSTLAPDWVRDRVLVCGRGQADCLVGAGLAAELAAGS